MIAVRVLNTPKGMTLELSNEYRLLIRQYIFNGLDRSVNTVTREKEALVPFEQPGTHTFGAKVVTHGPPWYWRA